MHKISRAFLLFALTICASAQECSTEKVNGDCVLTIDRNYPVTAPTIQLRRGKTLTVKVSHPLQFETLTLDPQSAQAVAGTDQTAGLLTALIPYTKSFVAQSTQKFQPPPLPLSTGNPPIPNRALTPEEQFEADLALLDNELSAAEAYIPKATKSVVPVYMQLQEILSPLPRPLFAKPDEDMFPLPASFPPEGAKLKTAKVKPKPPEYILLRPQGFPDTTPNPWKDFANWRRLLLCELQGQNCVGVDLPSDVNSGILHNLSRGLPTVSGSNLTWTDTSLFEGLSNPKPFDSVKSDATSTIAKLPQAEQASATQQLAARLTRETNLTPAMNLLTKIQQDLTSYAQNIQLVGTPNIADPQNLGVIYDPNCPPGTSHCPKSLLLGAQVVFAVNTVNQIGVLPLSVTSASQKKAIATITVLYADPAFEVSTGVFFSTLPNRSFANQTLITQGTPPTQGNVVIAQTIVRPTIVPFAAANWRLGHDSVWPDKRRLAWYLTAGVGLNPNNTTAEFAFGPSISWRAIMISALYHLGHDVQLTQGEYLGEVWCNQTAKTCSPTPPNPTTDKVWTGAFAIGIGIRIPTTFGSSH